MAVIITHEYVVGRLRTKYAGLLCRTAKKYRRGQSAEAEEKETQLLAFAVRFAPWWTVETLKKADCYFN